MENKNVTKTIEEKYTSMTEIEHILNKPAIYIGSIYPDIRDYLLYQPSKNQIVKVKNVSYNAGLLKLFDEVLTNSTDERRSKTKLFDVTEINVDVNSNGTISIRDNGGIAVVEHKTEKMYIPRMIFGQLRTSANYTSDREGAGTNGLGSKLTNIYSKYFRVTTSDGKKEIDLQWSKNMGQLDFENIKDVGPNHHGTRTEFQIELFRFEIEKLDMSTIRIMQKRCIDSAAANPGLKITFNSDIGDGALNSIWEFDKFDKFVSLHLEKETQKITQNNFDDIVLVPHIGYNYGFINGAVCSVGNHFKKIQLQITTKILEILKKQDIELITPKDIENNISIFCSVSVVNPEYESQSKIELKSKLSSDKLRLGKQFLDSLENSEILTNLIDFYNIKYLAEQKKNIKKLNGLLKTTKSKKLISCGDKNAINKELWLFEGTSASNGFLSYRDPNTMACYQLRGKVKNTLNLNKDEIVNNIELREIIAVLGLQFGDPKGNIKNCTFSKIIIASDMDYDGDHICGLIITFFAKNFPELFLAGRIYRAISPIVIASKGYEEKFFFTNEEFHKEEDKLKGWEISYIKGLGSLQDQHYDFMLNNQRLMKFTIKNKNYMDTIKIWFDKSTSLRKEILLSESNSDEYDEIEI